MAKATTRANDSAGIAIWAVLLRTACATSGSEMVFNSSVATAAGDHRRADVNPGAADLIRQVAEDQASRHKGDAQNGKSEPGLAPTMLCEEQHDESGDRAEAGAAERQAETRHPNGTDHPGEIRTGVEQRRDRVQRSDEQQGG